MKKPNERTPPQRQDPITCKISGALAEHIKAGAVLSDLTPQQYVLSLLWRNVPLKQDKPSGLPDCVQLVLNDIHHHYVKRGLKQCRRNSKTQLPRLWLLLARP